MSNLVLSSKDDWFTTPSTLRLPKAMELRPTNLLSLCSEPSGAWNCSVMKGLFRLVQTSSTGKPEVEHDQSEAGAIAPSDSSSADPGRDSSLPVSNEPSAWRELTDEVFETDPRFYLSQVTLTALTFPRTSRKATEKLLPKLLCGTPARRRLVHLAIRIFGHPKEILEVALEQFRGHGYEGRLTAAASLLADFGADSWPVLRSIAKSEAPECEAFVGLIAGLNGVSKAERLSALTDLAKNPDPNTRLQVLEALEEFAPEDARPTLEALARPEAQEDSAREAARQRLQQR